MTNLTSEIDLSRVTAISFDGDETLWDFRSAMRDALEFTLRQLRAVVANDASRRLTARRMEEIADCVRSEHGLRANSSGALLDEVRRLAFIRTLEYVGAPSDETAAKLFRYYKDARLARTQLYEDVPGALERLGNRYRMGMISNGNSRPVLTRLPVKFDFAFFAHECGYAKPDSRIFGLALAASRCKPGELLHVGDSLADDVSGASSSGLLSAWLNRRGQPNATCVAPDLEIRDLSDLATIMEKSSDRSSLAAELP